MTTNVFCPPDVSPRTLSVEHVFERIAPGALYRAFTQAIDTWFAAPGRALMRPEVNVPFFFETVFARPGEPEQRHAHYGRFLRLEADRLMEMTWVTGSIGTKGAETVVTIELTARASGTHLRLTHAGFVDEESRQGHAEAWPQVLAHLEAKLRGLSA